MPLRSPARLTLFTLLCLALSLSAGAQDSGPYSKYLRPPDLENVSYGPATRNVFDLWRAPTEKPAPLLVYIHAGGFFSGDKTSLSPLLLKLCLERGISVASINYRYTTEAPFPAPMLDGVAAIQKFRLQAEEWNIDPNRIAATGGSAGGGISLWIALHNELADPDAGDPQQRQSSRLACAAGMGAQTTYDPLEMTKLVGEIIQQHPGFDPFYGFTRADWGSANAHRQFAAASPITYLSPDDPPVFLAYDIADKPPSSGLTLTEAAHHPRFGDFLKTRADELGVIVVVRKPADYSGEPVPQMLVEMVKFFEDRCGF